MTPGETNTYPIKLRVTHERITNYYPTIYSLSQEDYDKLSAPRLNTELQEVRAKLQEIERTAKNAAKELDPFSFDEFERVKTESTMRSDPKPITVYITENMWRIIDRWGNRDKNPNNYIFPILEPGLTPLRQYELVQLFVSFVNEWMRRIAAKLGITKKITTYVARHTFSTVLKRSGASTEFIQEALGHTDLKTTENYLDSFEKEVKKEYANRLIAFEGLNTIKQVL